MIVHLFPGYAYNLKGLHVYGDLLEIYNSVITTSINEAGRLWNRIRNFENKLLTVYVSYILTHEGFYLKLFTEQDFTETAEEKLFTNEFTDKDWIENFDIFPPEEDIFTFEWVEDYENTKGDKIRVIFVTLLVTEISKTGEEIDEAKRLIGYFRNDSKNFVVVHPLISRITKDIFLKAKEKMKVYVGEDVLLSTGEFVSRIITDEKKRQIIEENWIHLREKLLGYLQAEWPILTYTIHKQELEDIEEKIRQAKANLEMKRFEEAIMNAAVSCEGMLHILFSIYRPKKTNEKLDFYDLLCILKNILREEFGSDVYQDLDFIREWRNKVVHPSLIKPYYFDCLKVVKKTELFYELFKKKLIEKVIG